MTDVDRDDSPKSDQLLLILSYITQMGIATDINSTYKEGREI